MPQSCHPDLARQRAARRIEHHIRRAPRTRASSDLSQTDRSSRQALRGRRFACPSDSLNLARIFVQAGLYSIDLNRLCQAWPNPRPDIVNDKCIDHKARKTAALRAKRQVATNAGRSQKKSHNPTFAGLWPGSQRRQPIRTDATPRGTAKPRWDSTQT